MTAVNGANNTTLRTQDLDFNIVSVFNTTSAPTIDISSSNYFTLSTPVVTTEKKVTLKNSGGVNMLPEVYEVNLRLSDPGNEITFKYIIDMLIVPTYVKSLNWQVVCDGEQQADNWPAIEIEITDGQGDQNGWYIFAGQSIPATNNVVTIDRTNARLTNPSGAGCPATNIPFFSPTSSAAVRSLWKSSDCTCSTGNTGNVTATTVDITGYFFEIE